jgi:hypothetical protein
MSKLYDEAGIPQDSYYMNKGAAAARAEADNSFYERLMGARRQKVLQSSKDAFADGIQFNIDITPDIEKMFEPGGGLETLAQVYYQNGGQDGDDDVGRRSQRTIRRSNRTTDLFAKGLGAFGRSVNNLKGVAGFVQ